jgi:hypothetical protein
MSRVTGLQLVKNTAEAQGWKYSDFDLFNLRQAEIVHVDSHWTIELSYSKTGQVTTARRTRYDRPNPFCEFAPRQDTATTVVGWLREDAWLREGGVVG